MSRTRQRDGVKSPVKAYLEFKGGKGQVTYFDKSAGSEGERVTLDKLDFIVLDIKASVSGYNEKTSSGVSSNLIDPLDGGVVEFVIKSKEDGKYGEVLRGLWKDIKAEADAIGGKYTTNIFALADLGSGLEIVNLQLNGSSLSPWITFAEDNDVYNGVITISKGQLCKRNKGATVPVTKAEHKKVMDALKEDPMSERPVWFYIPQFTFSEINEDLTQKAEEADVRLQEYFDESGINASSSSVAEDDPVSERPTAAQPKGGQTNLEPEDEDDLPF